MSGCDISPTFSVELSSAEEVFLDQDLLNLILSRVPITKLACFTSVSKLWHSLITAPPFIPTSGLFFQVNVCKLRVPNFISFVPLDNHNHTTSPFTKLPFVYARDPCISRIRIVHSCAGLLLCSSCPTHVFEPEFRFYIYNPTTNQLLTLPRNYHCEYKFAAVLAFEPSKSSHYKVFLCATPTRPQDNFPLMKQFYIYSSETGTWKPSGDVLPFNSTRADINFINSVYCNGCIHWISESISVSETTDRNIGNSFYYFNLDQERLETMPRPPIGLRSSRPVTFYMGVSQNHLHVVEVYACDNLLKVYEMESDCSGWFLKYEVDLSPISQVFPQMTMTPDQVYVLSLVRREIFEEDSFLVLHIPGTPRKAVRYNLVDKSFKGIWECSYRESLSKKPSWSCWKSRAVLCLPTKFSVYTDFPSHDSGCKEQQRIAGTRPDVTSKELQEQRTNTKMMKLICRLVFADHKGKGEVNLA
ncbi:putative F-box family protein [Heracleum sosnowskyi]|uniref:F-box family protein n=1 Tax=Heracleum sosnowskyi TaxID=360622 RepID=A0AAD8H6T0_9APIA|nr:putative F-box family protein [Heracleum sosnowskyi]